MDRLLTHVRAILAGTPERWHTLAGVGSVGLLERPPAEGEWSALQCLQHAVDTERSVFPVRVMAILEGRDFVSFDPDADGHVDRTDRSAAELAAELERLRAASLAVLDRVGDGDLERTARHAELGRVTLRELLNEWAAHDLMHVVQAERALMQAFIPGSGAWRPYFADHDVEVAHRAG